jgi:hypothetical protein
MHHDTKTILADYMREKFGRDVVVTQSAISVVCLKGGQECVNIETLRAGDEIDLRVKGRLASHKLADYKNSLRTVYSGFIFEFSNSTWEEHKVIEYATVKFHIHLASPKSLSVLYIIVDRWLRTLGIREENNGDQANRTPNTDDATAS